MAINTMVKNKPIKNTTIIPIRTDNKRQNDLRRWRGLTNAQREVFALSVSKSEGTKNPIDPMRASVVHSKLTNCVDTPADYGIEDWRV